MTAVAALQLDNFNWASYARVRRMLQDSQLDNRGSCSEAIKSSQEKCAGIPREAYSLGQPKLKRDSERTVSD
jgi:hypothetical protein